MSISSDLEKHMGEIIPLPGESIEEPAQRLFNVQTEFYSAHAGFDLLSHEFNFDTIPEKHKEAWMRSAQRKMNQVVERTY